MSENESISIMEKDAIGEILNISMGAAATAISTLLNKKVLITTPEVTMISPEEFDCTEMEPAVGIEIEYVEGLTGSNIMIMKQSDIKKMVGILISGDAAAGDAEDFNEMHVSAICEIMNQMMGSSSTALANFFGKKVNISTPKTFDAGDAVDKVELLSAGIGVVSVKFNFYIEQVINSEFITVLPIEFVKELVSGAISIMPEDEPQPEPQIRAQQSQQQQPQPRSDHKPQQAAGATDVNTTNLELLMNVPLEVTVEIGRTRRQVKEILEIRSGSIIELDKQASDPVEILVNGRLIAKGDVVVIDDNFGVRITEIVNKLN